MCRVTARPVEPVRPWPNAGKKEMRPPRELHAESAQREAADTSATTGFPRRPAHKPESFPTDIGGGDRPPGDEEEPDSGCRFQFQLWRGVSEEHHVGGRGSHTNDRQNARNQSKMERSRHPRPQMSGHTAWRLLGDCDSS